MRPGRRPSLPESRFDKTINAIMIGALVVMLASITLGLLLH